ncbi:MAG TPA: O-acetyl-ADP-ribose deacetylase [Dehalococcoidia bacterium]|nr:O-acetyl-ADP-ribose deacetylase [Dehalococcoidia bacterium]
MEQTIGRRRIVLTKGDITQMEVDAIVNAANSSLMGGGGVDGAIHRAGGSTIKEECRRYVESHGQLPPGHAMVTTAGRMAARYVIHTVGPVWHGGSQREAETLASAYRESLRAAEERHLSTVAFPSISTGAYGYPVDRAARVAIDTVAEFLAREATTVNTVTFVLFDEPTLRSYEAAMGRAWAL